MSKISDIIKARESGNNLHFIKKADLEVGKIYPILSAIRNNGTFGEEIRVTLAETDNEGKHLCVTNGAIRPDGKPTLFATLFNDFSREEIPFDNLGIIAEEIEVFGKECRQLHFVELF